MIDLKNKYSAISPENNVGTRNTSTRTIVLMLKSFVLSLGILSLILTVFIHSLYFFFFGMFATTVGIFSSRSYSRTELGAPFNYKYVSPVILSSFYVVFSAVLLDYLILIILTSVMVIFSYKIVERISLYINNQYTLLSQGAKDTDIDENGMIQNKNLFMSSFIILIKSLKK